jgi:hypothetical protein
MSNNTLLAIAVVAKVLWLALIWIGTVYLVGWQDWSAWWFVLTVLLSGGEIKMGDAA